MRPNRMSHGTSILNNWETEVSQHSSMSHTKDIFADFQSSCNTIARITGYEVNIKSCNKHKEPVGIDNFGALKHQQSALLYGFPCQMKIPTNDTRLLTTLATQACCN